MRSLFRIGVPFLLAALLCDAGSVAKADSVVVFNEIMYHPGANTAGNEWLELHNQMSVDVDMSGWSIASGVAFAFPEGTVIPGGGYLVVALSPPELAAATGLTNILGPYTGHLSNSGEKLELYNRNQRLMDSVTYAVGGDWPVGPDGSGVSLAKKDEDTASGPAANWTVSALVGGSPGRVNFPLASYQVTNTTPVLLDSTWKYLASGQDPGSSWRQLAFDDSSWPSGQGAFQAGSVTVPLGGWETLPTVFNSGVDANGVVLAPGSADPHYWLTLSAQSTPPPPAIPATVIQNHPAWLANDTTSSWIGSVNPGTVNVAAGDYNYRTTFSLNGYDPASAVITAIAAADNRLTNVFLNGISQNITFVGFASFSPSFPLTNGLLAGTNTLDFFTVNDDGPGPNPAGFRIELSGTGRPAVPSNTTLPTGQTDYYFRGKFMLAGSPELAALQLQTAVADGAVFYLNGTEVLRLNMPAGPITASTFAVTNVPSPAYLGPYVLPASALVSGTNVLAVEVHPAAAGTNHMFFAASLALSLTNVLVPPPTPLAFNEASSATNDAFWFNLINYGSTNVDLAGCVLSRHGPGPDNDYTFPAQTLAPGELVEVTQDTLGFEVSAGDRLFLYGPGGSNVLDAVLAPSVLVGRWPDGAGAWAYPAAPTPGASNSFVFNRDIVINEIMYHPPSLPAQTSSETWVELFNRGSNTVDLTGWALGGGPAFSFTPGTSLPAGGYLVVANDVAYIQTNFPGIAVVGPFSGKLSHHDDSVILTDAAGNIANQVHYFNGGRWPAYADGGGSSLELRNPWADNSQPEAWAASDETGRSSWSNYTYSAVSENVLGPTQWNEFQLGLLDAGECLLDNFQVVQSPSTAPLEFLQNGTFETGLTAWRILGNHSHSFVETDPDNATNHVLHLVATGPTETLHNHLETTYANSRAITDGMTYQVSFRAKWLAGNNHLNTRLYFNRVAQTTVLPMPSLHGTPGAPNSTFTNNIGPTFAAFGHSPIIPQPNQAVTVSASASDPAGVQALTLWWSVSGGAWQQTPMLAGSAAGLSGYTNYAGLIPGQPAGTLVQFYVRAADNLGVSSTFPARGPNSRALFKVANGETLMPQLHRLRMLMTAADTDLLMAATNVMSNDLIGLTLVYDETQVFYDVGIHIQSSERGRDDSSRQGFTVKVHPEQPLRGFMETVVMDRSGGYSGLGGTHDEILLWHAINHAGGLLGFECDLVQEFAPTSDLDGTAMLRISGFDGNYFDEQFKGTGSGNLYKLELIYYPTTTLTGDPQAPKLPQPDNVVNVDIQNWGSSKENYRWIFLQENNADIDDYSQLMTFSKSFSLSSPALGTETALLMDSDQWMRTMAFKAFTGDVDTFTAGLNHNFMVYFRPSDGKALGLLWDEDYSFVAPLDTAFPGTSSPGMYNIITLPNNYRLYYNHLLDLMTTTINSTHLGPWATRYAGLLGENWSGVVNYLQQRATFIRSTMPLTTPFAITGHAGNGFATSNNMVSLTGTAPLTLYTIQINGVPYPITWLSLTNWTVTVPLFNYSNLVAIQGFDNYGALLTNASASIVVTNLAAPAPRPVVINEWMAKNSGPTGFPDPADGKYSDWFELYNPNASAANISGFYLTDDLSNPTLCQVPANTVIPPYGFLLVWADNETSLNGSGTNGDIHVSFKLSQSGATIALFGTGGTLQNTVSFGAQLENVSQGLFPDGNTNAVYFMPNWTPRASNQTGSPPPPQIAGLTLQSDGSITFQATATPWRTYSLEFTENLAAAAWTPLGANQTATGSTLVLTDNLPTQPQRFYRLVLMP
jgi:hypothetical protein